MPKAPIKVVYQSLFGGVSVTRKATKPTRRVRKPKVVLPIESDILGVDDEEFGGKIIPRTECSSSSAAFEEEDLSDEEDPEAEKGQALLYEDGTYLPVLFKLDGKGVERFTKIWVEGNVLHGMTGVVGGKPKPSSRPFKGVNIGKKSETTPEEQTLLEADRKWVRTLDKGYQPKCREGQAMMKRVLEEKRKSGGVNTNAAATIRGRGAKKLKKVENYQVGVVKVPVTPMKCYTWKLTKEFDRDSGFQTCRLNHMDFEQGVYLQYKIDGYRCVTRLESGKVVMTTNNKKEYPWFGRIRHYLKEVLADPDIEDLILDGLDGEIYCHNLFDEDGRAVISEARFSMIQSIGGISRSTPHPLEDQIQIHVFDLVDLSGEYTFQERFQRLREFFRLIDERWREMEGSHPILVPVYTKRLRIKLSASQRKSLTTPAGIKKHIHGMMTPRILEVTERAEREGYEGIIIRDGEGVYEEKRSLKMGKFKFFFDREYQIVDFEHDEGVEDQYFTFVLEDPDIEDRDTGYPLRFKGDPAATHDQRRTWYHNRLDLLGKYATVKYQEMTERGVPRFPKVIKIRERGEIARS